MDMPMDPPWYMGRLEWLELGLFVLLSIIILALLTQCRRRRHIQPVAETRPTAVEQKGRWRTIPEVQLLVLALPLELLWEVAQFPLYTVWHEGDWGFILYGLAHCTLGDLLILQVAYGVVALLNRDRHWYLGNVLANGFLFTILGTVYTVQ